MNNKVKFLRGTSNEYAVAEKDSDTIYFTTDDGKLYIGDKEISGTGSLTIDDTLSDTSTNPVQNKVVKQAIDNKADKSKYGDTTINVGRSEDSTVGDYSTAEGSETEASGKYSHAEGAGAIASGKGSHAEGYCTTAIGNYSHAEGQNTIASGEDSHAEGNFTTASGIGSHTEGSITAASGIASHAEGYNTTASGNGSHAEGSNYSLSGTSLSDRTVTISNVDYTISGSTAYGINTHAEGSQSFAYGYSSHAEGSSTTASGWTSHAEGDGTTASGDYSHAEGKLTTASGYASHTEGNATTASSDYSHAEGKSTAASGLYSHAEGRGTTASGNNSHAEGATTAASNYAAHAEGNETTASGTASHAEGQSTTASGNNSHAEGNNTTASGNYSHAEGYSSDKVTQLITDFLNGNITKDDIINTWKTKKFSVAHGNESHVEGQDNLSLGHYSHTEGLYTVAIGDQSHTSGYYTKALHDNEAAYGKYNVSNDNTLFSIGDGTADDARHNAFEITTDGGKLHDKDIATTDLIPTSLPANGGNADTVGGHTVGCDVPENAVFTDTIYDDTELKESIEGLSSNLGELDSALENKADKNAVLNSLEVGSGNITARIIPWSDGIHYRGYEDKSSDTYTDIVAKDGVAKIAKIENGVMTKIEEISTMSIKSTAFSGTTDTNGNLMLWAASENKIPICAILTGYCSSIFHYAPDGHYYLGVSDINRQAYSPNVSISGTVYYI